MRPEIIFPFFMDINTLKGIGTKTALLCEKLCGTKIIDLLFHIPSHYIDRSIKTTITEAPNNEIVTLKVETVQHILPSSKKSPYRVICKDETGIISVIFFHAYGNYPEKQLPIGQKRFICGKFERNKSSFCQMIQPDYIVTETNLNQIPIIDPIYPLTASLSCKVLSKSIKLACEKIPDLPEWQILNQTNNITFKQALKLIHNPIDKKNFESINSCIERLAYDELLANQLALAIIRNKIKLSNGLKIKSNKKYFKQVLNSLPFSLTAAQNKVLHEIIEDLQSSKKMTRIVQGDVGSGKTIIALLSMLFVLDAGFQSALMAPTDILANQHYEKFKKYIGDDIPIALITGKIKGKTRKDILEKISNGEIKLVIGTHSIFSEDVTFKNLALAITDEQHKFGVNQRLLLSKKGEHVDVLAMTATPIPRTLALTAYGDMDISKIDMLPPERKEIQTSVMSIEKISQLCQSLTKIINAKNKIYWVCPLVEDNESLDFAAAKKRFEELSKFFPNRVGLLYGKMTVEEKKQVMDDFISDKLDILVSTTVIEVGVDVPSATVIVIENAQRFGLAQLHQLRGRVGRNSTQSYCILLYSTPLTDIAKQRLNIMKNSQDGFYIAEQDLKLRGCGEILGTKQSGLPEFKIADLEKHIHLLNKATTDAANIIKNDPHLISSRGKALRLLLYLFQKENAIQLLSAG
ncbi:MAG: ATP-dependent DNA helicase RecG [Alphaproteobacteria bacterium]|nr:ATP-dependent DNA helicase RecG [Alphaproteobacteria bacterium]